MAKLRKVTNCSAALMFVLERLSCAVLRATKIPTRAPVVRGDRKTGEKKTNYKSVPVTGKHKRKGARRTT